MVAILCEPASAGPAMLGAVQAMYVGAIQPLQGVSANWSGQIFRGTFALESMYVGYECLTKTNTIGDVVTRLLMLVVGFGLGSYLIQNQVELGNQATLALPQIAQSYFLPGTTMGKTLDPDGMLALGDTSADAISNAEGNNPVVNLEMAIPNFFAGLSVEIAFLIIGVESVASTVGIQLVLAIGAIMLGFVGCRWTRPIAFKYVNFLVSAGILLISVNAVCGIGALVSDYILAMATTMSADATNGAIGLRSDLEAIAAAGFGLIILALSIPAIAAWLSQSGPVRGASEAAISGMQAIASYGAGAGAAVDGMAAGAGAASADRSAVATIEAASRTS